VVAVLKKAQGELATKRDIEDLRHDMHELGQLLTIRLGSITALRDRKSSNPQKRYGWAFSRSTFCEVKIQSILKSRRVIAIR
jgi:hypothetical protein